MKLIWYNPLINDYQLGSKKDFNEQCTCEEQDRFEVIYEFDSESSRVANKILINLRKASMSSHSLYLSLQSVLA